MINPELGRACVRVVMFMLVVSGALLGFQQPGTAEFVVTVATLVMSSVFLLVVAALIKWSQR